MEEGGLDNINDTDSYDDDEQLNQQGWSNDDKQHMLNIKEWII